MFSNLSVGGRIYLGIGVVSGLLAIISVISFFATSQLATVFNDYRSTARQTLVMGDLTEDLFEARLAAFSYRIDPSADKAAEVRSNIDEILDTRGRAEELFGDNQVVLKDLEAISRLSITYREAFDRMSALQKERNEFVSTLSETGPKARKQLTSIMVSAYADGDGEAAYFAGIAQQELMLAAFMPNGSS